MRRARRSATAAVASVAAMVVAVAVAAAMVAVTVTAHELPHENSPSFLLDDSRESTFAIPMEIGVGLIGFNGDGAGAVRFAADELALTLQNSLPALRPNCLQSGEPLNVQYKVDYTVRNFASSSVHSLETVLQHNMKFVGRIDGVLTYDVEATAVADTLQSIYALEFGRSERTSHTSRSSAAAADGPAVTKTPYAILILNPSKAAMRPEHANSSPELKALPFAYRYRYNGGAATQAWVAERRYVVVDVTAGPCEYGVTDSGEGTVSVGTIPPLATRKGVPSAVSEYDPNTGARKSREQIEAEKTQPTSLLTIAFEAQLASVVVSAVRHIFVTDVRFSHVEYSEKLIVPIVVFRNHNRFDPFAPKANANAKTKAKAQLNKGADAAASADTTAAEDAEFFIDVATIRSELKKMLLPHQELLLVTGVHSLHDHHHIATSVFKAIRSDTIHSVGSDGVYRAKVVPHIDSAVLEDEMRHAADALTASLLQNNGLSHHAPIAPPLAHAARVGASGSHGHRVLPVYVFSLLGLDKSLLFDHRHVHVSSAGAVMVLQTGSAAIPLPFFSHSGVVHVNARSPTRHIVAGLATAMGGLMNPFERYSADAGALVHDYLWANGHHPFGPFSATAGVSDLFVDAALRNSIISRVEHSLEKVRRAVRLVDQFTNEYVRNPYGDKLTFQSAEHTGGGGGGGAGEFDSILQFWTARAKSAQSPLADAVVTRLESELTQLSASYDALAHHFQSYALDEANTLSGAIVLASASFSAYATEEIAAARIALKCCTKQHHISPQAIARRWSVWSMLALLAIGVTVAMWVYGVVAPARRAPASASALAASKPAYRYGGSSTSGGSSSGVTRDRGGERDSLLSSRY